MWRLAKIRTSCHMCSQQGGKPGNACDQNSIGCAWAGCHAFQPKLPSHHFLKYPKLPPMYTSSGDHVLVRCCTAEVLRTRFLYSVSTLEGSMHPLKLLSPQTARDWEVVTQHVSLARESRAESTNNNISEQRKWRQSQYIH